MLKSYLSYALQHTFGVVFSPKNSILFDRTGKLAIAPALEHVVVWNVKLGTQVQRLVADDGEVECMELGPDGYTLAVGCAAAARWQCRKRTPSPASHAAGMPMALCGCGA